MKCKHCKWSYYHKGDYLLNGITCYDCYLCRYYPAGKIECTITDPDNFCSKFESANKDKNL